MEHIFIYKVLQKVALNHKVTTRKLITCLTQFAGNFAMKFEVNAEKTA